jgi:hypothetical protein
VGRGGIGVEEGAEKDKKEDTEKRVYRLADPHIYNMISKFSLKLEVF